MTIQVVAPATMQEGYTFETKLVKSGRIVPVTVPRGGVTKGETFEVQIPLCDDDRGVSNHVISLPRGKIPLGHWKDGLCDCLSVGLIHPVLCNAWLCPIVLTAQVMHRLRLDWCANPTSASQGRKTFWIILYFYAFVLALNVMVALVLGHVSRLVAHNTSYYNSNTGELVLSPFLVILLQGAQMCNYALALYSLLVMIRTRHYIRQTYLIPPSTLCSCCPSCVDDCCTIYFCNCCALSQMARHTADYEIYPAKCCTETGLPDHVPSIV